MISIRVSVAVLVGCLATCWVAATTDAAPSGQSAAVQRAGGGPSLYGASDRPAKYCPANQTCFTDAHWRKWGSDRAVAVAKGSTYYPGATHGTKGKATFVFVDPQHICGGYYFTKATWHYKGKHGSTSSSLASTGSSCYWTGA